MSNLSADQLRALFAKGILKHSSKGKNGKRWAWLDTYLR